MITRLVLASIRQRPGRSLLLLLGYGLGVGVTIALLSIGGALVEQARDRQLIGGGDLIVLPAEIDLETLRTGGVSSMFFTIEQAPFLYREVLSAERFAGQIEAAAPWVDDELVYLELADEVIPASAGATVPSLGRALGVEPAGLVGVWDDVAADSAWRAPGDSVLYASLDALHLPAGAAADDSTWAEWHYFNVLLPGDGTATEAPAEGWLYLTYMVAGDIPDGRWGGRLLATLVRPGLPELVFSQEVEATRVEFEPGRPDLRIASSSVSIGAGGAYALTAEVPSETGSDPLTLAVEVRPASRRYLPPLEIGGSAFSSGYTVPLLDARARGRVCVGSRCTTLSGARTYHDHNWGVWEAVTWDWGQATAGEYSILYGGVARSGTIEGSRFLLSGRHERLRGHLPHPGHPDCLERNRPATTTPRGDRAAGHEGLGHLELARRRRARAPDRPARRVDLRHGVLLPDAGRGRADRHHRRGAGGRKGGRVLRDMGGAGGGRGGIGPYSATDSGFGARRREPHEGLGPLKS